MIEEIFPLVIIGIMSLICVIALLFPQIIKDLQIKLNQIQYNRFKKTPGLGKAIEYNLEISKSSSLSAIRLTGLFGIIFMLLVLTLILGTK